MTQSTLSDKHYSDNFKLNDKRPLEMYIDK